MVPSPVVWWLGLIALGALAIVWVLSRWSAAKKRLAEEARPAQEELKWRLRQARVASPEDDISPAAVVYAHLLSQPGAARAEVFPPRRRLPRDLRSLDDAPSATPVTLSPRVVVSAAAAALPVLSEEVPGLSRGTAGGQSDNQPADDAEGQKPEPRAAVLAVTADTPQAVESDANDQAERSKDPAGNNDIPAPDN